MLALPRPGDAGGGGATLPKVASLDVHKKSCTYVVMEWDKIVEGPTRTPTQRDALTTLVKNTKDTRFVFEATAVHEYVHDVLAAAGADVFVYKPFKRERRRGKSDPQDAVRGGKLRGVFVPPQDGSHAGEERRRQGLSLNGAVIGHLGRSTEGRLGRKVFAIGLRQGEIHAVKWCRG